MLDTIPLEFVTVGGTENLITRDLRGYYLADDIFVGEADDETVLRSVVFVLGLGDKTLAGVVVGLSYSTTLILGLIAATVLSEANYRDCK